MLYWPPTLDTVKDENFESVLHFIESLCKKCSSINKKQSSLLTILDEILKLDDEKFKGDKDGKTSFHLACHQCNDKVVELLLKKCDEVNHMVMITKHRFIMLWRMALKERWRRSDLKPKDNNGKTALDIAKQSQSMPIIIAIAERNCESTLYIAVATVVFLYVLSCLLNLAINSMF